MKSDASSFGVSPNGPRSLHTGINGRCQIISNTLQATSLQQRKDKKLGNPDLQKWKSLLTGLVPIAGLSKHAAW